VPKFFFTEAHLIINTTIEHVRTTKTARLLIMDDGMVHGHSLLCGFPNFLLIWSVTQF
jgi:hypothetical protein